MEDSYLSLSLIKSELELTQPAKIQVVIQCGKQTYQTQQQSSSPSQQLIQWNESFTLY